MFVKGLTVQILNIKRVLHKFYLTDIIITTDRLSVKLIPFKMYCPQNNKNIFLAMFVLKKLYLMGLYIKLYMPVRKSP